MEPIRALKLRSRVGPTGVTIRRQDPATHQMLATYVSFSFDNAFTDTVPVEWWEEFREQYLDRSNNLTYKEAFEVIGYGDSINPVLIG